MSMRDTIVAILVGAILLFLLSRPVGRMRLSVGNALWCSFIGHVLGVFVALIAGFVIPSHLGIALTIAFVIVWFFQKTFLQLVARTENETLAGWRAGILSLAVILGDFFIASPLIHVWEHYRGNA